MQDLSATGVPVGTTGLIEIHDLSDTGVPVGTTKQIQRYIQIFTLILYLGSYHIIV